MHLIYERIKIKCYLTDSFFFYISMVEWDHNKVHGGATQAKFKEILGLTTEEYMEISDINIIKKLYDLKKITMEEYLNLILILQSIRK